MNARTLYAATLKAHGVRPQRGDGYFYWLNSAGEPIEGESVYVTRLSDLPLETWMFLAAEASVKEKENKAELAEFTKQFEAEGRVIRIGRGTKPSN